MNAAKKIRVLMVDDEERFRETTRAILERRGFDVTAVGDGVQAVDAVREDEFDVVILDLKMPRMDGNEALREIKNLRPDIQVIMLTGHGTVESALAGLQDGVFDYLRKPCNVELLAGKIHEACHRQSTLPQEEPRASDIMVPLSTFSTIHKNATVRDAIEVIVSSFNSLMFTGTISESVHRSILIMDGESVVGVLSFIDLLRGVQPPYMRLLKDRPVMADSIHIEPPNFSGLFTILVRDLATKKVCELMSAAPPMIRPHDNLMTAVNRILSLNVRRLLVIDQTGKVVGVVREQDLFFEISRTLHAHKNDVKT